MKNLLKKPIGILISVILVFSLSSSAVFASTSYNISENNNTINEASVEISQSRYKNTSVSGSVYTVSNKSQLQSALTKSIDSIEARVRIVCSDGYLSGGYEEFEATFSDVIDIAGAGSYIKSYGIMYYLNNKGIYDITYNYVNGINDARNKEAEVKNAVKKVIASIITPNMSDYQKEKAIHDYVVNNTRYDVENMEKDSYPPDSHTAYGVFIKKVAVCEGYASAIKKLLDEVNIENLLIVGDADGVPHAWNLVKIDGYWSHVDATWNDPISFSMGRQVPILRYDYFNKTDSFMSKTHTWIKNNYPMADGSPVKITKKGTRFIDTKYIIR